MGTFILLFTILTIIFLISFIKLINDDSSNKIKIINNVYYVYSLYHKNVKDCYL